ncbi:MAG: cadherin repeat domain-containing protein, partial [Magnetococcales bacterium]|nr:cadherin repeat domain-containing protein [Magnetococcales bacterium]
TFSVASSDGTTSKVTINIAGSNDTPSVTSSNKVNFAENSTATVYTATATDADNNETATWSLSGTDASLFSIAASTGVVTFKTAPDFEAPVGGDNIYDIVVTVKDSGGFTADLAVAITVTDVSDSGSTVVVNDSSGNPVTLPVRGTITANSSTSGGIQNSSDQDSYAITMISGSTYTIDGLAAATNQGTMSDPYLYLYNSSAYITEDDDAGVGLNAQIIYTAPSTGTYYIWVGSFQSLYTGTYTLSVSCSGDPIVLDLDGNGVQLASQQQGSQFDMNGDGLADSTGWISANDGLLAMDVDGDGTITSIRELISPGFNPHTTSSREALASLDGNADGIIDQQDSAFSQLLVWQDGNSDGQSTPEELSSLSALAIRSLTLNFDQQTQQQEGQTILGQTTFTRTSGANGLMAEVGFNYIPTMAEAPLTANPLLRGEEYQSMVMEGSGWQEPSSVLVQSEELPNPLFPHENTHEETNHSNSISAV